MQSGLPNRRESHLSRPQATALPVRGAFKKSTTSESKTSSRPTKTSLAEDLKASASGDKNRAFPVESKMIQITPLKDTFDDEGFVQGGSIRSIDGKGRVTMNEITSRSRSQLGERQGGRIIDERGATGKNSINGSMNVLPNQTLTKSALTETPKEREPQESMVQTGASRRTSDLTRPMETRRGNEDTPSVLSGGNSTVYNDAPQRRRLSIARLIMTHTEGDEEFFEGTLIRGKKFGFCRVLYSTSIYKEGFFANNVLDGEATIKFPHGISVQGVFKNNMLSANILLTIDNTTYPIDFVQGEWHNDKLFVSDKNVLVVTRNPCKEIAEYVGPVRVYFRNGYRLDATFEKGLVSQTQEATLYDKFNTPVLGVIKHGINFEANGMAIFTTTLDSEEYMMQFKGEGTVTRKKKKKI